MLQTKHSTYSNVNCHFTNKWHSKKYSRLSTYISSKYLLKIDFVFYLIITFSEIGWVKCLTELKSTILNTVHSGKLLNSTFRETNLLPFSYNSRNTVYIKLPQTIYFILPIELGSISRYSCRLRSGLPGFDSLQRKWRLFLRSVQTGSGAHPTSHQVGTGLFLRG
jgi:hypothetical protein